MATDNPAFEPDQQNSTGVFTISNNVEEVSNNINKKIGNEKKEKRFWMGWYRQIQKQYGLKNELTSYAGTILLIAVPSILLPTILASPGPPNAVMMPPLAWIAGHLSQKIGLPPTPAMLLVGLLFRYLGYFQLDAIWKRVAALTRYIAVAVVLLKGGLALAHLPNLCLTLLPSTLEAATVAVMAYCLLGFPVLWACVFGFAMSAASSSVNVEKLTRLKAEGYGAKELYALLLPTSTVENIYSITIFTVTLTLALIDEGDWSTWMLRGILPCFLGVSFAVSWGFLCSVFPNRKDSYVVAKRSALALLGGCLVYLGAKEYKLAPGGPLGTMLTGAALAWFWRAQGWTENNNPVLGVVSIAWNVLEAALFSLVGAEVDVFNTSLRDILIACLIMIASLAVRLVVFYIVMLLRRQFTNREILFGLLVWFPKATVLAALSPQVVDNVRKARHSPPEETSHEFVMSQMILLASVVEMIATAPISYIIINTCSEKILKKSKDQDKDKDASLKLTINEAQLNNSPCTRV